MLFEFDHKPSEVYCLVCEDLSDKISPAISLYIVYEQFSNKANKLKNHNGSPHS